MPSRFYACLFLSMALISCNDLLVYSKYQPLKKAQWEMASPLGFEFSGLNPALTHNMFIHIRNNDNFQFSNLFLIAELEHPNGNTLKDTLEYKMAKPNGEWLGRGLGSIKENKLWFKENIVFRDSGIYKVTVSHAMRRNGAVEGLNILEGVTDVGLRIEKSIR